jgi:phage host-nuclease inhibitor protein Gam
VEPICNCIFYFLAKEGYTKISNYTAGMNEWIKDNPTISEQKEKMVK